MQGCSKKFYQPDNDKLQAGSWLKNFRPAKWRGIVLSLGHAPPANFENQRSRIR